MNSKLIPNDGSKTINRYVTHSPKETEDIGRGIARTLRSGSIVCLTGELGAGKTTLTKGLASELTGMPPHHINSPTFTYVNVYSGHQMLYHFDCYRLRGSYDFLNWGFDEYFNESCIIEWAEKIEDILPKDRIFIMIEYNGEGKRVISYEKI